VIAPGTVLLAAGLAVVSAGCFGRTPGPGDAPPRVDYVRRSFQSSLAGCADPESGAPGSCVHIEIEYVDATRATAELSRAVADFVRATVLRPLTDAEPPPSLEALRDDLYESYRELQEERADYRVPWRLKRSVTVACNTEQVQGLVGTEQSFTGGARRIERVQYRSFDTRTGRRIGLEDLVAPEHQAELLDELTRRARAARDAATGQSMWNRAAAPPDAGAAAPPDDVLACPDTLTVRWHPAAGAEAVEVVVPRDEVRTLLRAEAP
jgi:hypothetical protein